MTSNVAKGPEQMLECFWSFYILDTPAAGFPLMLELAVYAIDTILGKGIVIRRAWNDPSCLLKYSNYSTRNRQSRARYTTKGSALGTKIPSFPRTLDEGQRISIMINAHAVRM
jgi:hypothetical protein